MKKTILFLLIIIGSLTISFAQEENAIKKLKDKFSLLPPGARQKISVMVFKMKRVNVFREAIPIMGTITPSEKIELRFPEKGVVKKVYVQEGDEVEKGQILAELEDREFILRRDYAKNKYEAEKSLLMSMKKAYEINKALYDKKLLLEAKLEELSLKIESQKYKMKSARKEWELAEESLSKIKLVSTCKGKIDKKEIERGELVGPEVKAFTILRIDKVFAEVGITQKDISKVKRAQKAEISVDTYPDEVFKGDIKNILPSIKGTSRTLTLKIEIDNASYDYRLLPGMFLRGEVILTELEDVDVVPSDILLSITSTISTVYTVNPKEEFTQKDLEEGNVEGVIMLRQVKVIYKGSEYSCIEGLPEESLVITRAEGEMIPNATGRIVHVEEYEEE